MSVARAHAFNLGTVPNPLPTTEASCPECGSELWTAWNPMEAMLAMMFAETKGLVRVVCTSDECAWQGSARDVKG